MALDFAAPEIEAAAGAALAHAPADDPLVAELSSPDGLPVAVGVQLAELLVPDADPRGIADGATSFLWGLLVSANLVGAEGIADSLPAALELVRRDGRATVIARHCDLTAVAEVERTVGVALRRGERPEAMLQGLLQLFELGLAVGLASRYA